MNKSPKLRNGKSKLAAVLIAGLTCLVATSGSRAQDLGPAIEIEEREVPLPDLDPNLRWASGWYLTGIIKGGEVSAPYKGESVRVKFSEHTFRANFGANSGGAEFFLGKAPGSIRWGEFGVTEMASLDPGIMKQEPVLIDLFIRITNFKIEEDELYLLDPTGKNGLKYKPVIEAEPLPLAGTEWQLEYVERVEGDTVSMTPVPTEKSPSITFGDGIAKGFAGVHEFDTAFKEGLGGRLKIDVASPKGDPLSAGAEDLAFEREFLALIPKMNQFVIKGSRLVLSDTDQTVNLVFKAQK